MIPTHLCDFSFRVMGIPVTATRVLTTLTGKCSVGAFGVVYSGPHSEFCLVISSSNYCLIITSSYDTEQIIVGLLINFCCRLLRSTVPSRKSAFQLCGTLQLGVALKRFNRQPQIAIKRVFTIFLASSRHHKN